MLSKNIFFKSFVRVSLALVGNNGNENNEKKRYDTNDDAGNGASAEARGLGGEPASLADTTANVLRWVQVQVTVVDVCEVRVQPAVLQRWVL